MFFFQYSFLNMYTNSLSTTRWCQLVERVALTLVFLFFIWRVVGSSTRHGRSIRPGGGGTSASRCGYRHPCLRRASTTRAFPCWDSATLLGPCEPGRLCPVRGNLYTQSQSHTCHTVVTIETLSFVFFQSLLDVTTTGQVKSRPISLY